MRKLCVLFFILSIVFMTGCGNQTKKQNEGAIVDKSFVVNSIKWGSSWESVKDSSELSGYKIVKDDGNRFIIELSNYEYLGQTGKLTMLFSNSESSFPATGFIQAYFEYDDAVEKEIIEDGEKIYGERKGFFLDEKGIENPLNPPAWYCEETLEKSLNEKEKEEFLKKYEGKGYEDTRIDALLRGPLVIITVDEEKNVIRFLGNDAAVVENLRK